MIELRDYQEGARKEVHAGIQAGEMRQLVVLPTGGGKTVVFSKVIQDRGGSGLIIAHREELLEQAADKLAMVAPELALNIGFVKAKRNDVNAPIIVASVQTLANPKRLLQLPRQHRTVIVDEAHHAPADSYQAVLEHVNGSPVIGFTATAFRADARDLRGTFDRLAYAKSLEEMIREGYLCDLRAERITIQDLNLKRVKKTAGDYQAKALGAAMDAAGAVQQVVAAYLERAKGRKAIAFFPTVALSKQAADAFQAAGVRAAHIDGDVPTDELKQRRKDILRDLAAGHLDVVTNVDVLTEGFDEPTLECVIIARPTKSAGKYMQMIGRGTRLSPGKTYCLILDCAGVTDELSLQTAGMLFDLKAPPKPGETLTQAKDREAAEDAAEEEESNRDRQEAARLRKVAAERRDLFTRDSIHWVLIDGRWVLGMNDDKLLVLDHADESSSAGWRVLVMGEDRAQVAAKNMDLGYAQGAAEHLVRSNNVIALADRAALWRQEQATSGQYRYIRKLGVAAAVGLTKGEAADVITEAVARRRLERFDRAVARRAA